MAYKSLIQNQVNKVFNVYLKDLVEDVTLGINSAQNYDFATGEVLTSSQGTIVVKGAFLRNVQDPRDEHRFQDQMLIDAQDVPDFSVYNTISTATATYSIESFTNDGYVITAVVSGG